jgi:hypothetical protein
VTTKEGEEVAADGEAVATDLTTGEEEAAVTMPVPALIEAAAAAAAVTGPALIEAAALVTDLKTGDLHLGQVHARILDLKAAQTIGAMLEAMITIATVVPTRL